MPSPLNQRMIERAMRAAHKAGTPPTSVECHPDGKIILCFGQTNVSEDEVLARELDQWRASNATN